MRVCRAMHARQTGQDSDTSPEAGGVAISEGLEVVPPEVVYLARHCESQLFPSFGSLFQECPRIPEETDEAYGCFHYVQHHRLHNRFGRVYR
jgi:hypothetical protein